MYCGRCRSDFRIRLLAGVSTSFVTMVLGSFDPARQNGPRWQQQRCRDVLHTEQPLRIRWPNSNSHRSRFARSQLRPRPATLWFQATSRTSALSHRHEDRGPVSALRRGQGTARQPERKDRRSATAHLTRGTERRGAVPPRSAITLVLCGRPFARVQPCGSLKGLDNLIAGQWRVQNRVMLRIPNLYQYTRRKTEAFRSTRNAMISFPELDQRSTFQRGNGERICGWRWIKSYFRAFWVPGRVGVSLKEPQNVHHT
jgi:hypothetical protein